jgi:hypothetical protein
MWRRNDTPHAYKVVGCLLYYTCFYLCYEVPYVLGIDLFVRLFCPVQGSPLFDLRELNTQTKEPSDIIASMSHRQFHNSITIIYLNAAFNILTMCEGLCRL